MVNKTLCNTLKGFFLFINAKIYKSNPTEIAKRGCVTFLDITNRQDLSDTVHLSYARIRFKTSTKIHTPIKIIRIVFLRTTKQPSYSSFLEIARPICGPASKREI
jgi:hypothetical protein